MRGSNTGVVIAILVAGGLIAAAIVFTRSTPKQQDLPASLSEARTAVVNKLKDPESAAFRNIGSKINGTSYCGEINAKNGFGAYVGYKKFNAFKGVNDDWFVTFNERLVNEM